MNYFMKQKNLARAIDSAREDERQKCEEERIKVLEEQKAELDGSWYIKTIKLEAELRSVNLRLAVMEKRNRIYKQRLQEIREISVLQNRVAEDIKYIEEEKRLVQIEDSQFYTQIAGEVGNIERRVRSLDEK